MTDKDDVIRLRMSNGTADQLPGGKVKEFIDWMRSAYKSDLTQFNQYLDQKKDDPTLAWQKMSLMQSMIAQPEHFTRIKDVFDTITDGMDFRKFYDDGSAAVVNGVWQMCEKSPRPEVAQVGAVIMAEYLRHKVAKDPNFVPDLNAVFKTDFTHGVSITDTMRHVALRNSIVMIQNALVDAVTNDKDKYVLNRGIPFLAIFKDDAPANTARFWTQKLQDVKFAAKYDPVKGDLPPSATPIFVP